MGLINISQLKEGMILDSDIKDDANRYRMPKGTQLTEKHIRVLKIWGIKEIDIKGLAGKENVKIDENQKILLEAGNILKPKFIHNDIKHEAVQELFKQCLLFKVQQLKEDKDINHPPPKKIKNDEAKNDDNIDITKLKIDENELVKKVEELPTLPEIFYKLNSVINDPRSSANDIGSIISKDSSLTLKVLKLANSAFYGLKTKIDNISRAVVSLGTTEIGMLAVGLTFVSYFKEIPNDLVDMESFWKHNISCAIAAKTIAGLKAVPNSERLFIGGLIHDIGRLVLFKFHPVNARVTITIARQNKRILHEVEHEVLNIQHASIAKLLVRKWKLPLSIENMVSYHHKPTKAKDPLEPAIINIADLIVNALDIGTSGEYFVPVLEADTWKVLNASKSIFETAIRNINKQLTDIIKFFVHEK